VTSWLPAALVGLGAGILSGAFGVGGGVVTTPAIRMLLGYPELIAVGTPLPVILPTAIAGAFAHVKQGTADIRTGLIVGAWGAPASVAGALLTRLVGGTVVLIVTAGLVIVVAVDMLRPRTSARRAPAEPEPDPGARRSIGLPAIGLMAGAYSGFLGLGGGFVLVPLFNRMLGFPIKRAIGTSLVSLALFAVPGSLTHLWLGNIDVPLALALTVGVVPGAFIGARFNSAASERAIRTLFALMLAAVGVLLGLYELGVV
jgi:uncharacterized membrane protein YfcA